MGKKEAKPKTNSAKPSSYYNLARGTKPINKPK